MPQRAHAHHPLKPPPAPEQRPSAAQRGYGRSWARARAAYLLAHPLCVDCRTRGTLTPAKVVDHVVPHRGNHALFWDAEGNWAALCTRCHNAKTGRGQ